jgi:hypothetical protein
MSMTTAAHHKNPRTKTPGTLSMRAQPCHRGLAARGEARQLGMTLRHEQPVAGW